MALLVFSLSYELPVDKNNRERTSQKGRTSCYRICSCTVPYPPSDPTCPPIYPTSQQHHKISKRNQVSSQPPSPTRPSFSTSKIVSPLYSSSKHTMSSILSQPAIQSNPIQPSPILSPPPRNPRPLTSSGDESGCAGILGSSSHLPHNGRTN